jgi:hypothetical protein
MRNSLVRLAPSGAANVRPLPTRLFLGSVSSTMGDSKRKEDFFFEKKKQKTYAH